jgi:hypothetical protein
MAQFPIEIDDQEGLVSAVNSLLSGPSGLGQNFAGFSSYTPAWLTGNFRVPYAQPTQAELYVAPIPLSQSEMLDGRTIKFTFETEQASPPFSLGNGLSVKDVNVAYYNDIGSQIGVVECTTSYVVIRSITTDAIQPIGQGGTVSYSSTDTGDNSTDCNARVTVTGGTDRVFVSAQLDQIVNYLATGTDNLSVRVRINRYFGIPNNDPVNPDFIFINKVTISEKSYNFPALAAGTGTLPLIETVFTSVIDQPDPGYYWYILEVAFNTDNVLIEVTTDELELRSLSAQVVKQ